jgi:hypothetical protein
MLNIQTICPTSFGKFKINVDNKNINVGGKTFCVNIALYETETTLYWLKTEEGGCELNDKEIRGNNTVNMTDLAFSLLQKYHPERTNPITLIDDSGYSWIEKNRKYKTNFLKGYLLFHRKTWYEDKFNAVMCDRDIYNSYRIKADNNFDDPEKKPEKFDFIDSKNKEELELLYKNSKTWGEFINKLQEKYGNDKYKQIYHWYRNAIYIIFDGMEINQNWEIDILQRPYIECSLKGGYLKKTIKNKKITFKKYYRLEPFSWSP